jgi:hypothetical protein
VIGRLVDGGRDPVHDELLSYLFSRPSSPRELLRLGRRDAERWLALRHDHAPLADRVAAPVGRRPLFRIRADPRRAHAGTNPTTEEAPRMTQRAAITVLRDRDEVQRLWASHDHPTEVEGANVTFTEAPGDRGTEIHIALEGPRGGRLGEAVKRLMGTVPRARAMDDLRRFKQLVETGVIARSDGAPEGEAAERKLKQRPAQPLAASELDEVGI